MSRSRVTVRIQRPIAVVYEKIASHAWTNDPAWEPEVLGVGPDGGGLRVGGRVAMTRRDFGKVQTTTYEITALEPPRGLALRHVDGPLDFALEFVVAPAGADATDVTVTVDTSPRGAMRILTPIFSLTGGRRTARICAQMVAAIEASTPATAPGEALLATS